MIVDELLALLTRLWPLHRTLVSDGTDEALRQIGEHASTFGEFSIESYACGSPAWTWRVPPRFVVHEAFLETEGGDRVADFRENPLHLVSYSQPIDFKLDWEELEPHLHFSNERPQAIPWVSTFYEPGWGFCVPKETYDALPRQGAYRAVIRSEFLCGDDDGLRVGVLRVSDGPAITGSCQGEILLCAHVCHPSQANDDLSGAMTALGVAQRIADRPLDKGSLGVRVLFCPETIGSICYFSRNEQLGESIKGAVFCEMTGNRNALSLQESYPGDELIDRISKYVMERMVPVYDCRGFRQGICNDEMVINGPGIGIPCVSLNRWPYPEYHTSDDTPEIIDESMLLQSIDVIEEIVRIFASNQIVERLFTGPVFLSGYDLWVDWRENPELNRALELLMLQLEGGKTVFDIAEAIDLDYWETRSYLKRMEEKGLVRTRPLEGR